MKSSLSCLLAALVPAVAAAQTGTLDQVSPYPGTAQTASFNGSASSLIWQAQVRVGVAGQLEGFNLWIGGPITSTIDLRLRVGDGWNTSAVVFSTTVMRSVGTFPEVVFVDTTSANLNFASNDTFVIEMQGNNSGFNIYGTYAPPPATPQYPELLFLGGPGCFADCGWRMAFETYVLAGPAGPVEYCTSGTTTNGCMAEIHASANPNVAHSNSCQITVDDVEGGKAGIIFYGLAALPQPWCISGGGTSFLCVKAPTTRTPSQNSGGTPGSCDGTLALDWNAFQLANPGSLGAPWGLGSRAFVQGWFRDPAACKTTSLSNAVELIYVP